MICDMGFQVLSATPGDIDVTYTVSFSENGSAANKPEETTAENDEEINKSEPENDDKGSPDTGVEGVAAIAATAIISASAILISRKRK